LRSCAFEGTPAFEKLRNQRGARDEFHLAAIVQNLKTLANALWRPPPNTQAVCGASVQTVLAPPRHNVRFYFDTVAKVF
jgi:hypothetical protein